MVKKEDSKKYRQKYPDKLKQERKRKENKLYKQRHPEKVKEQRKRYLNRKVRKRLENEPDYLNKLNGKLLGEFDRLTRLLYDEQLPKYCEICGGIIDLQIHHMSYIYPIAKKDIIRLCKRCHTLEHQKLHPLKTREGP